MSDQIKAARITGRSTIIAAVFTTVGIIIGAFIGPYMQEQKTPTAVPQQTYRLPSPPAPLIANVTPWPRRVNEKFRGVKESVVSEQENTVFEFSLMNTSSELIVVNGARLEITSVAEQKYDASTSMAFFAQGPEPLISYIRNPQEGSSASIPISFQVEPGKSRNFMVWFQSDVGAIMHIVGAVSFDTSHGTAKSEPIHIVIHPDSNSWTYQDADSD